MTLAQFIPLPTFVIRASNDLEEQDSSSKEVSDIPYDPELSDISIIYGPM